MRKSFTIATLISLTTSMSLAYPALAQSGTQESQSVTSFQAQTSFDESQASQITLADQTATVTGQGASFSDQTLTITQAGTYVLTGSGKNLKLVVEAADTDQVHLVFQNLTLEGEGTLLQVNKAQEVVISLTEGSQNALTESQASDDEKVKATIHSQVPLTLNGTGNLTLTALTKNALEVEDDLKVLGGTYTVKAANHGFKAEGALAIEAATLTIEAGKDGLHAEHDETTEGANISLNPTQLSIAATEDGVDAGNELTIKGGTITVSQSEEGLEARVIRQLGGDVTIKSSDDGVNASAGSSGKTTDTSATSKTTDASATSNTADTSSSASQATTDSATASTSASQATGDPAATNQADQDNKGKSRLQRLAKLRHKAASRRKMDKGLAACHQVARKKVTQAYKSSLKMGPSPLMQKATALIPMGRSPLVVVAWSSMAQSKAVMAHLMQRATLLSLAARSGP